MNEYENMPPSFILCAAAEGQCPKSNNCLRSLCYHAAESPAMAERYLQMVNLRCPAAGACTDSCEAFCSNEKQRMAYGMTHIFDEVPRRIYKTVREEVEKCFSCQRVYFYCKNGSRPITPDVQEAIAAVFRRHQLTLPPQFDRFAEEYNWQ